MIRYLTATGLAFALMTIAIAQPPAQPDPEPIPLPLPLPLKKPGAEPKPAAPQVAPAIPAPATPAPVLLKSPKGVPQPTAEEAATLAKTLRTLMLANMPDPLVKANDGWGKQKEYVVGPVMLRNSKRFGPEAPRQMVNEGLWRRFTVQAVKPQESLKLAIAELGRPEANKTLITLNSEMDISFRMEQQLWTRGHQLYSGETRGHCKGGLILKAEIISKSEKKPGAFFPDITLIVKVTDAKLFYDKIVIDHTAGLDGADAKAAGDFVIDLVKAIKPDLEKQLLDKANAAILKAANEKEIKIQLDKIISGK
jgi:hypothetical protein